MDPFPVDVDMSTGPGGMRRAVQQHYEPPPLDLSDLPNLLQHHDWPVRSANPAIPEQDPCVNEDGIEQRAPSIVRMDAYDAHEAAAAHFPHGIAIEIAPESLREIEGQTFGFCLDDFDDDDSEFWFGDLLLSALDADVSTADTANAGETSVPAESARLADDDDDSMASFMPVVVGVVPNTPPPSFSLFVPSPIQPMSEGYTSTPPTTASFANFFSAWDGQDLEWARGVHVTRSVGLTSAAGL